MSKLILFPNSKSRDYYLYSRYNYYSIDITNYKTLFEFYRTTIDKFFKNFSIKNNVSRLEESTAIINIYEALIEFTNKNKDSIISKQNKNYELAANIYNFIEEITFAKIIIGKDNEDLDLNNNLEDIKKIVSIYKSNNKAKNLFDDNDIFELFINSINKKEIDDFKEYEEIEIYNFESVPLRYSIFLEAINKNYNINIKAFMPYNIDKIFSNYKEFYQGINNFEYSNTSDFSKTLINKNNKEYEVQKEDETDNYYIIGSNNSKEYLELNSVPLIAKVTMKKNTLLTTELLSKGDNQVQDDVRKQEYNMIVLPIDLVTGDYVDIRVMFPNGQDFIVVAKKEVEIPTIGTADSEDTIWMNLSEDEILHMSCAIVDSAQVKGAKIYATKYTEAGMQKAATPTYPINESTSKLLQSDPNILEKAMTEIRTRYGNGNSAEIRNNYINSSINNQGEQAQSNLETKMEESVTNSKNSRKEYLDSLSGTTTE